MNPTVLGILQKLEPTGKLTALALFGTASLALLSAYTAIPPLAFAPFLALMLINSINLTPHLLRLADGDASYPISIGLGLILGGVLAMMVPILLHATQVSLDVGQFSALEPLVGVYTWTRISVGVAGIPLAAIGAVVFGLTCQKIAQFAAPDAPH